MYDDCVKDYELEDVKDQVLELESALDQLRREFEEFKNRHTGDGK